MGTENLPERPDPWEMGQGFLWYPHAKIASQKMVTKGKYAKGYPKGAIVHFTAGRRPGVDSMDWGREQGYAFMLIDSDGVTHQAHPLDSWGYHAGDSSWPGLIGSVSDELVGIEISAAGLCEEVVVDGVKRYKAWFHKKSSDYFTEDDVRFSEGDHNIKRGWYQTYTVEQELELIDLLVWLKENDKTGQFSYDFVLGHDEVAPNRKNDPGAALSMNMPELRARLKAIG